MALISREEAMKILEPHVMALCSIPRDAWTQYHAEVPENLLVEFCPRTRASAVHNLMVSNAVKYASSNPDVRTFSRQKMDGITIAGKLAIRLKKLDGDSLSSNQPSGQVDAFRGQESLEGIEATHNLELGYVLNEHETDIAEIRIVCPSGRNDIAWWATLGERGSEGGSIEMFPITPESGPRPPHISPKSTGVIVPLRKTTDEN